MKRYQLIGRKATVKKAPTREYPKNHIHSLPYEILLIIFGVFRDNISQLTKLALVCSKFNHIINKNYLYKTVLFQTPEQFLKFSRVHITSRRFGAIDTTAQVNLIQSLEIRNPPHRDSKNYESSIAGSYNVEAGHRESQAQKWNDFMKHFKTLMANDYNLKLIIISQISPQFQFDIGKPQASCKARTLDKLVLKAQTGWSILFKPNTLSTIVEIFGNINNLELHNFIINEDKLYTESRKMVPFINRLTLVSCSYSNRPSKRQMCDLFTATSTLSVKSMQKSMDLSFIDMIKCNNKLSCLSLDLDCDFFYSKDSGDFNYKAFNPFFKLICSKSGNYSNLKILILENFDLVHELNHDRDVGGGVVGGGGRRRSSNGSRPPINRQALASIDEATITESAERTQTIKDLFHILSSIDLIIIKQSTKTCKNCGHIKVDKIFNWSTLNYLTTNFKILDHKNISMFDSSK